VILSLLLRRRELLTGLVLTLQLIGVGRCGLLTLKERFKYRLFYSAALTSDCLASLIPLRLN
jgi:hypothetical protein